MMQRFINCSVVAVLVLTALACQRETPITPFRKISIYHDTFDSLNGWDVQPAGSVGDTCFHVRNGVMFMQFDDQLPNCGCAWIRVQKLNLDNPYAGKPIDKFGFRLVIEDGFFQLSMPTYPASDTVIYSEFSLIFNQNYSINIPDFLNGFNPNFFNAEHNKHIFNKLDIVYNVNKLSVYVDDVLQHDTIVFLSAQSISPTKLDMTFHLGHTQNLNPRREKLVIDELEIYTWEGDFDYKILIDD